ncbi:transposase [Desulfuromonas sp. TF]|uniref:REP-associated tyrosine transposase n=1 Tax=Desulfuromonas sp. TF TaxID=1232410 RepID=UPI000409027E|nr:transposase [Desulfuromonas sp. TF]
MARPLRIEYPGALYHVTSRGNHRQDIFANEEDRDRFLGILAHTVRRHNWFCHAYCLLDNHYHLVIETPDGNLSRGMRQVGAVYTQAYNRRHGKSGHLFQGRYKAVLVERESHLLEVIRYVLLNPVRAGATKMPEAWPWSSYRGICGIEEAHSCLSVDWVLGQFGQERKEAVRRFRNFVRDGMEAGNPFERVKGQIALGGEGFLQELAPLLEGKEAIVEIPRQQRMAGRPALEDLFAGVRSRKERDAGIIEAVERWGYSQKEVADRLGLHYSSVSRIVGDKLRRQRTEDRGQQRP